MRLSKTLKKKLAKRMSLTRKRRGLRGGVYSVEEAEDKLHELRELGDRVVTPASRAVFLIMEFETNGKHPEPVSKNIGKAIASFREAETEFKKFNTKFDEYRKNMPAGEAADRAEVLYERANKSVKMAQKKMNENPSIKSINEAKIEGKRSSTVVPLFMGGGRRRRLR